jgi:hypothetical protein
MGYVLMHGPCIACGQIFSYNPHAVPSVPVEGKRQPVCKPCITKANAERVKLGRDPHPIRPDAYEPLPEAEL